MQYTNKILTVHKWFKIQIILFLNSILTFIFICGIKINSPYIHVQVCTSTHSIHDAVSLHLFIVC